LGKNATPEVSVIAPALNEEANLGRLVEEVAAALDGRGMSWELIVVLDGCTDGSVAVVRECRKTRPNVKALELRERVGQHAAIAVGLRYASGRYVVTIDADLQNPPSAIPGVVDLLEQGVEAVGTVRSGRRDPAHRLAASRMLTACFSCMGIRTAMTDPGCMLRGWSKAVIERFLESGDVAAYLPVQLNRLALSFAELQAPHRKRGAGESRYSLLALVKLFGRTVAARYRPSLARVPDAKIVGLHGFREGGH